MKKLFALLFLIAFFSCEKAMDSIPDKNEVHPVNCYSVNLLISTTSGEILNQEINFIFVYEPTSIKKWKAIEGINVIKDTVNHTAKIQMIQCIRPDIKINYK